MWGVYLNSIKKITNPLSRLSAGKPTVTQRKISEYAKRMGYTVKPSKQVAKINHVKNALFFIGSGVLLYDIAMDKQKHFEVFTENFDEKKKYFRLDVRLDMVAKPNMDFLVDDFFLPPMGDGKEATQYVVPHGPKETSPAMLQPEKYGSS